MWANSFKYLGEETMHEKASVHDSFTIARCSPETCVHIDIYKKNIFTHTNDFLKS